MDTKPKEITEKEWQEIVSLEVVREAWGLALEDTAKEFSERVFGARFDFVSGMPGYCGDVFVLYGDALQEPMTLYWQYPDKRLVAMGQPELKCNGCGEDLLDGQSIVQGENRHGVCS